MAMSRRQIARDGRAGHADHSRRLGHQSRRSGTCRENGDATLLARTPFHDQLYARYPMAKLSASGRMSACPKGKWAIPKSDTSILARVGLSTRT